MQAAKNAPFVQTKAYRAFTTPFGASLLAAAISGVLDVAMVAFLQVMLEMGYEDKTRTGVYIVLKTLVRFMMLLAPAFASRTIQMLPRIFGYTMLVMAFPVALEVAGYNRFDALGDFLFYTNFYMLPYLISVVIGYSAARNLGSRESIFICALLSIMGEILFKLAGHIAEPGDDIVVDSFFRILHPFVLLLPPAIFVEWRQNRSRVSIFTTS